MAGDVTPDAAPPADALDEAVRQQAAAKRSAAARKAAATRARNAAAAKAAGETTGMQAPGTEQVMMPAPPAEPELGPTRALEDVAATVERPGRWPSWARVLTVLTVLLVAVAAGLGTAALVERGPRTYASSAAFRLVVPPTFSGDAEATVLSARRLYAALIPVGTDGAATAAKVPPADVRGDLRTARVGKDEVRITARAATAGEARALASAALEEAMSGVESNQRRTVADPRQRLVVEVSSPVSAAEQTEPSVAEVVGVGSVAGAGALLIAVALVLRRRRRVA